jgi:aerobic carbon-monoxide dehydrogenase medium subunit
LEVAVKPVPFAYHRPASLPDALTLLERYGADGRILAGGQSLVPTLNMRLATPSALIDINRIPGLDEIRLGPEGLVLGALARLDAVERSPLVAAHAPLIAQALPHVAHLAVRTRSTVGGSLALADPAAELPACIVALGATVRAVGRRGQRDIPAAEFFRGVYTTALAPEEVLTAVVVPPLAPGWRSRFDELARRHGDYALVGLAAHARVAGATIAEARLVLCGVGTTPVRAVRAEAALAGRRADAAGLEAAARVLADELDPPSDLHASAALRRRLAGVLLRRTVPRLLEG